MKYNRLLAVVDKKEKKIMYIEDYGPEKGFFIEGLRALHYPLTSSLVEKTYRDGNMTICIVKEGTCQLDLTPSFSPLGIQECRIKKDKVELTISGLGGAGVSASFSRGMAKGVEKVEVLEEGGGKKLGAAKIILPAKHILLIGVDDTDVEEKGATYSLVHNIALEIA